jgi:hypothetical protein
MIFLIAIFVPPIALVIRDAKYDAIASLIMLCLGILLVPAILPLLWVAGIVHCYAVLFRQDAERRNQEVIAALQGRTAAPTQTVTAPGSHLGPATPAVQA